MDPSWKRLSVLVIPPSFLYQVDIIDFPEALKCELVVTVTGRGITKKD